MSGKTSLEAAPAQAAAAKARTLHLTNPLMTGPDVVVVQQLLAPYHPGAVDGEYGPATAAAAKRAKWALGYPDARCDGAVGTKLVAYLSGTPLPADYEARREARAQDDARYGKLRDAIVDHARWGIANEAQIHYRQLRPIDGLKHARQLPLQTDCSGFSTLCYAWAGAPDPNGLEYSGLGYTGTMLQHMTRIPLAAVRPGDLVVWGPPPGHHVALVLETDAKDPLLCSHGQEKGPFEIRFSVESRYQPTPAVWLTVFP